MLSSKRGSPLRVAAVVSGSGSNLQAIIDATRSGELDVEIVGVISNVPDVRALSRAKAAGIQTRVINHRDFTSREDFDHRLVDTLESWGCELLVLAGFMRILSAKFFERFRQPILNIHPALLPAYPGLDTHARVIADGGRWHGASVHFVTPALDAGPVIVRGSCPVLADDTPARLASRVHGVEHRIYPQAIQWFAQNRLTVKDGQVLLDGIRHDAQGLDTPN